MQHWEAHVRRAFKATPICTIKLSMQPCDRTTVDGLAEFHTCLHAYQYTPHAIMKHDLKTDYPHTFGTATRHSATIEPFMCIINSTRYLCDRHNI
jgi:hypothetical protein